MINVFFILAALLAAGFVFTAVYSAKVNREFDEADLKPCPPEGCGAPWCRIHRECEDDDFCQAPRCRG